MSVDVILPESIAVNYAKQVDAGNMFLPRRVAEGLYPGIFEEGRCARTNGILYIADLSGAIQNPMDNNTNMGLIRAGKIQAKYIPYTQSS